MWYRENAKLGKIDKGKKKIATAVDTAIQTDIDYEAPDLEEGEMGTYSRPILGKETGLIA